MIGQSPSYRGEFTRCFVVLLTAPGMGPSAAQIAPMTCRMTARAAAPIPRAVFSLLGIFLAALLFVRRGTPRSR